jgi:hypothetical protein
LLFLRRAGFLATQVLVDPPRSRQPKPASSEAAARQLGIPTYVITTERDIEVWRTSH